MKQFTLMLVCLFMVDISAAAQTKSTKGRGLASAKQAAMESYAALNHRPEHDSRKLSIEIGDAVDEASSKGLFFAIVRVSRYDEFTINKLTFVLKMLGYKVELTTSGKNNEVENLRLNWGE